MSRRAADTRSRHPELADFQQHTRNRAVELITDALEESGISQRELARRMGVQHPYVIQMLDGNRNFTVNTLTEILYHLGYRPVLGMFHVERAIAGVE